jgi:hypothetical protein
MSLMTAKRVNYFPKVVTESKSSSIIFIGKNLKLGPQHTKITTQ